MNHRIYSIGLLVFFVLASRTLSAQQPKSLANKFIALKNSVISNSGWDEWANHILPDRADLKWQQISWLPTFSQGIEKAAEVDKPILLWTMNGHPLGCT